MFTDEELSVIETLAPFDTVDQIHIQRHEILSAVSKLNAELWNSEPGQSEYFAFTLVEDAGDDCWGTYYGPYVKYKQKDTGEFVCTPDKNTITPKIIDYWERRANTVVNPKLKMRYTGLVLDFKESVTGVKPNFNSIRKANIVATLEVTEALLPEFAYDNLELCVHALDMAKKIRNQGLMERGTKALIANYKLLTSDNCQFPSIKLFGGILRHKDLYSELIDYVISQLNYEFDSRESMTREEGNKTDTHVHILRKIAELLCKCYKVTKQEQLILSILNRTTNAIRLSFGCRGGMWVHCMMEDMQKLYRKYHLYKEADELYKDIIEQSKIAQSEFRHVSFKLPISSELWERHWQHSLDGSDEDVILYFLLRYVPNVENEIGKVAKDSLLSMGIRVRKYDSFGIPTSNIGTGKKPDEQRLFYTIDTNMKITDGFLNEHINRLKDKGILNVDYIMNSLFKDSVVLREEQRPILERGFKAFFEKDYIVACHLLIPMFESAIRVLCKINGGDILRPKNNPEEGNEYKSLEGLLSQKCVSEALGDNITTYFRVLLTDSNGGNLRNYVSHGTLPASSFSAGVANRIFHAFLLLSLLKPINFEQNQQ